MSGSSAVESVMASFEGFAATRAAADDGPRGVSDAGHGPAAASSRDGGFAEQLGSEMEAVEAAAGGKNTLGNKGKTATVAEPKDSRRRSKKGDEADTAEAQAMAALLQLQPAARPYEAHVEPDTATGPSGVTGASVNAASVTGASVTGAGVTEAASASADDTARGSGAVDLGALGLTSVKEHLAPAEIAAAMMRSLAKAKANLPPAGATDASALGRSEITTTPAPRFTSGITYPGLVSLPSSATLHLASASAPSPLISVPAAPMTTDTPPANDVTALSTSAELAGAGLAGGRFTSGVFANGTFSSGALGPVGGPVAAGVSGTAAELPTAKGLSVGGAAVTGNPPLRPTLGRSTPLAGTADAEETTSADLGLHEDERHEGTGIGPLTTAAEQSPAPHVLAAIHGAFVSSDVNTSTGVNVLTASGPTGHSPDASAKAVANAEAVGHRRVLAGDAHGALSVENLGRFEVRARTHEDGRVDVQVQAQHQQGAALLDKHAAELRADVRAEVPRAQVHVGQQGSSGADNAAGSFARSGQRDGQNGGGNGDGRGHGGVTGAGDTATGTSPGASTDRRSSRVRIVL